MIAPLDPGRVEDASPVPDEELAAQVEQAARLALICLDGGTDSASDRIFRLAVRLLRKPETP